MGFREYEGDGDGNEQATEDDYEYNHCEVVGGVGGGGVGFLRFVNWMGRRIRK